MGGSAAGSGSTIEEISQEAAAVLLQGRATSTVKKYQYAFQCWARWAKEAGSVACLASDVLFSLYLLHMSDTVGSKAAIEAAVNVVAWAHELMGVQSVMEKPLVRASLKGLRRKLAKPVVKKRPVTAGMLRKMAQALGQKPTLAEVRLLAAATLAFAGFLQYDELANLKCCDVVFHQDHLVLYIRSSKTDQLQHGAEVVITRMGTVTCPVSMLQHYYCMAGIVDSSEEKLFRGITKMKHGEKLRATGGLSYSRI